MNDSTNPDKLSTDCLSGCSVTYDSGHGFAPRIPSHDPCVPTVTSLSDTASFPPHQYPGLRGVDHSHPYRQVMDLVDFNFSFMIPRTTTSITTTVHVQQQPSSIPMSNGHSPAAASHTVPELRPYHFQPPPVLSAPARASASAIGNALESHLGFDLPPPYSYSDPGDTQHDPEQVQVWSLPQLSQSTNVHTFKEASPVPKAPSTGSNTETTSKRKAKMHTCLMCNKSFPRPSGLHTHMNTHNNARPFPCTYPGCYRTFGVRSNAKRHLRTHGLVPDNSPGTSAATPSRKHPAAAVTSGQDGHTPPYVVSFQEPIIVADVSRPAPTQDEQAAAHDIGAEESANSSGSGERGNGEGGYTPPFYKVRWLPLSLTSRTGAAALKNTRDQRFDEDQESRSVEGQERFGEESASGGKCGWQSYASPPEGSHD